MIKAKVATYKTYFRLPISNYREPRQTPYVLHYFLFLTAKVYDKLLSKKSIYNSSPMSSDIGSTPFEENVTAIAQAVAEEVSRTFDSFSMSDWNNFLASEEAGSIYESKLSFDKSVAIASLIMQACTLTLTYFNTFSIETPPPQNIEVIIINAIHNDEDFCINESIDVQQQDFIIETAVNKVLELRDE